MRKLTSKQIWGLVILGSALILRIIYFIQIRSSYPGWDTPTIDPLYHDLWAKQIASGDILGSGPFFRAPFYAYMLGFIYALLGPSLTAAKLFQHFLGSVSCLLIFLFSDRYFGRRVAVAAGIISVFYWVFIYFEDELLLDSLLVFFSIALIWLLLRAYEKPTLRRFFLSGIVLGLAAITRPNFLAIWPVILIWMFYSIRTAKPRENANRAAILTAGMLIMVLPVTARNIIIGGDNVIVASQGGINFYIGNNRWATGATAVMPEFGPTWQYADCEYLAKAESGRIGKEMKQSEVSSFYYKRALDFITDEPEAWAYLMLRKLSFFWNSYEISNNQNLYFFTRFASITYIMPPLFFIISPLSIIGLAFLFTLEKKYHIIGLFILSYMATIVAFFVNSRFRLPILPFLIILSSFAAIKIWETAKKRDYKNLIASSAVLAVLIFLCNTDFFHIKHTSFAMSHFSLGNVYLKKGLKQDALEEYQAALDLEPCVPSAHLNRGIIYFGENDFEKARREFVREIESCKRSAQAHNNISVIDRLAGDYDSALSHAVAAIEESPQYLEAHINLILVLMTLGENGRAYDVAENLTINFPHYLPGYYFKGKLFAEAGKPDPAQNQYRFVIRAAKEHNIIERYDLSTIYTSQTEYGYKPQRMPGLAYYELGIIFVNRGEIDSALVYFQKATEILPEYRDAWTNLALAYDHMKRYNDALGAYKKSMDLDPENPYTLYNFGLTLGKMGMVNEAAEAFRIALNIKPDFREAAEKLGITESLIDSLSKK